METASNPLPTWVILNKHCSKQETLLNSVSYFFCFFIIFFLSLNACNIMPCFSTIHVATVLVVDLGLAAIPGCVVSRNKAVHGPGPVAGLVWILV
jgi:hypothetical protein